MISSIQHALLSIARCTHFGTARTDAPPVAAELQTILSDQAGLPLGVRQVPEPWRGSYTAPLLIVGSNPSRNPWDDCPRHCDSDSYLVDYFDRVGVQHFPKIPERMPHGPALVTVRFWAAVGSVASQLWGRPSAGLRPGEDFTLMDIVPYKSRGELGVARALSWCLNHQWESRMQVMQASVVVVLGAKASRALGMQTGSLSVRHWGSRDRLAIALPHPASFEEKKRPDSVLSRAELDLVVRTLRGGEMPSAEELSQARSPQPVPPYPDTGVLSACKPGVTGSGSRRQRTQPWYR